MQVSQLVELDTHAVIGGGKARSFGMSDSAEFFTVLSNTLYRDKKLAVVREVICNGWDAHIFNDRTDIPLEIQLSDQELIIRDFGPGIADDRIVPIYCIYGSSTKVRDESQTGGFGLGSKAPFAYTDHFTVTSCHAGRKIVYAISRGGSATEGKPEIRQIVSVPTEESGITVTIPLREAGDRPDFLRLIRQVVMFGGIKAKLNGTDLVTVDYRQARSRGYCAVKNFENRLGESHAYVLYGTVVYPVLTTDQEITQLVGKIAHLTSDLYRLVLVAPPNSVGVTPSREALSFSQLTTDTIKRLLTRALNEITAHRSGVLHKILARGVHNRRMTPNTVDEIHTLRGIVSGRRFPSILVHPGQIVAERLLSDPGNVYLDKHRAWAAEGLIRTYPQMRRELLRAVREETSFADAQKVHTRRRFVRMLNKLNMLDAAVVYHDGPICRADKRLLPLSKSLGESLPVCRDIKIVPNKREFTSMVVGGRDDYACRTGDYHLGIVVGQKPSDALLERIEEMANKYGFFTEPYDFDYVKPKVVRAPKVETGYHSLDSYVSGDVLLVPPALQSAKFFMRAFTFDGRMRLGLDMSERYWLSAYYPGQIAVITTKEEEQKLRATGAINIIEELQTRVTELFKLREVQYGYLISSGHIVQNFDHYHASEVGKTAVKLAQGHMDIAKAIFPDRVKMTGAWNDARILLQIWRNFPFTQQEAAVPEELAKTGLSYTFFKFEEKALEKSLKTFAKLYCKQADAPARFGYLALLAGSNWTSRTYSKDCKDVQTVISVVKHLQRLNDQSKLTARNSNMALKEAA